MSLAPPGGLQRQFSGSSALNPQQIAQMAAQMAAQHQVHAPPAGTGSSAAPLLGRGTSMGAPALAIPKIQRAVSATNPGGGAANWRGTMPQDDRTSARQRIGAGYAQCTSLEELRKVATQLTEELVYGAAVNRLDYVKMAISWEQRVSKKRTQVESALAKEEAEAEDYVPTRGTKRGKGKAKAKSSRTKRSRRS